MSSRFLIVTTGDLPEAYFLATCLMRRGQPVGLLNLRGRSRAERLRLLLRLARRRGPARAADVLLGRLLHRRIVRDRVLPFPEIDLAAIDAVRRSCPTHDSDDLHGAEALAFAERVAPDYMLLAGAPIIRPALLRLARRGVLNRHVGLVPGFRGSDCPVWALALGRPDEVGFTIHFVTERVDAGDVIVRQPVAADGVATLGAYLARVQRQASEAFVEVLDRLIADRPLPRARQPEQGRHFPPAGLSAWWRASRTFRAHHATQVPSRRDHVTA